MTFLCCDRFKRLDWPLARHDGRMLSGRGHGPRRRWARGAAATQEHFTRSWLSHEAFLARRVVRPCRRLCLGVGQPLGPWSPHRWDYLASRVPPLKQPGRRCTARQRARGATREGRSASAVRNRGAGGGVSKTPRQCRDAGTAAARRVLLRHVASRPLRRTDMSTPVPTWGHRCRHGGTIGRWSPCGAPSRSSLPATQALLPRRRAGGPRAGGAGWHRTCTRSVAIRPNGASLLTGSMEQCLISKGHGCKEDDFSAPFQRGTSSLEVTHGQ